MGNNEILVSISCITYNHAPYIRQCLDGFLMQRTNFAFEVLIHDDCSTDGTTDIIKEYEAKYPDIIKPIYEDENQYQQGKPSGSSVWNFPRAKGKYIAICEGDDYWIDPLKLQMQVDFMEKNPDYSLCFHSHYLLFENKLELLECYVDDNYNCSISDMIKAGGGYMSTNSMLFRRNELSDYPQWAIEAPIGDFPLMLVLFYKGMVAYLKMPASVYRVCAVGSWSSHMQDISFLKNHYKKVDNMLRAFDVWSESQYHGDVMRKRIKNQILKVRDLLRIKLITKISCKWLL